ncbi:hypothetical protein VTN49DRAFT_1541 [Thermomyces lanuginosus]|uniref:uncharacterized protein n=1 Tax=Thermomyces lanuginosus TaxID=5541 RepID=UPI0037429067
MSDCTQEIPGQDAHPGGTSSPGRFHMGTPYAPGQTSVPLSHTPTTDIRRSCLAHSLRDAPEMLSPLQDGEQHSKPIPRNDLWSLPRHSDRVSAASGIDRLIEALPEDRGHTGPSGKNRHCRRVQSPRLLDIGCGNGQATPTLPLQRNAWNSRMHSSLEVFPHSQEKSVLRLYARLHKAESSSILTQLRTGKIGLASFLHKADVPGSHTGICPHCEQGEETPRHVLIHRPRFQGDREALDTMGNWISDGS